MARRNSSDAARRMSAMHGSSPPMNVLPSRKNRNASSGAAIESRSADEDPCREIVHAWREDVQRCGGHGSPWLSLDELGLVLAATQAAERHQLDLGLHDKHVAQSLSDRLGEGEILRTALRELDGDRKRGLLLRAGALR